jgi:two-component system, OmpR family, response regulator VicR
MTDMSSRGPAEGRPTRRILVVEDDRALATVLKIKLTMEGFEVECASDGAAASNVVRSFAPDLIVLDVTLPGTNGFELCRIWRESLRIPIIMLTARSDKADKLRGLTMGADDYMTKPFDTQELVARILAVLRRTRPTLMRLQLASVSIDFENARAQNAGKPLKLTRREFAMLRYLAERPNSIVHRDELLRIIWGYADVPYTDRAVDQAVLRLRKKIESNPHQPQFLHTAHGDGYYLALTPSDMR